MGDISDMNPENGPGFDPESLSTASEREAVDSVKPDSITQPETLQQTALIPTTESGPQILLAGAGGRAQRPAGAPVPERGMPTGQRPKRNPFGFLRKPVGKLALAGVLATGIGAAWVASNQDNDGGDDERGAIIAPLETNTPKPSLTVETVTPDETKSPQAIETATLTQKPEASEPTEVSPETRAILDRYYLKVGEPINTYGKTTLAVSKLVQERDAVSVPNSKAGLRDTRVTEVLANTENVSDADKRIDKAYSTVGLYLMWNNHKENKPSSQQDLVSDIQKETDEEIIRKAEEFRRRVDGGEDFTFTMAGFDEKGLPGTVSKDIVVNPIHGVKRVTIPTREGVQVIISTASGVSYTAIDGHLIIGTYGSTSEGIDHLQHPADAFIADIEPSAVAAYEIAIGAYAPLKNALKTAGVVSLTNHGTLFKREYGLITKILIPDSDKLPPQQQSGSIVAR